MIGALLTLHALAALGLLVYGLNAWVLSVAFLRGRRARAARHEAVRVAWHRDVPRARWPRVCVQLPVRNERTVVRRLLDAVGALDWPRERLHVQVLDDSDDDTSALVAARVARLCARGLRIEHVRRAARSGFKAGALAHGLARDDSELVAILDADFVPAPDALQRLAPFVMQPGVGLVQARWGHLDRDRSALTRAQALAIDGHFGVEQAGRAAAGWFVNFNGTAGLWRREAIDDAGGWSAETLTEDLDLSYRAQLRGWRVEVLDDAEIPAELPASLAAFKSQQRRWARGSMQTARLRLGAVWRSGRSLGARVQAALHLTHYLVHPLMLVVCLVGPLLARHGSALPPSADVWLVAPLWMATLGPIVLHAVAQRALRGSLARLRDLPRLMLLGCGVAVSNGAAALAGLLPREAAFVRTPKRGDGALPGYRAPRDVHAPLELALGLWTASGVVIAGLSGRWLLGAFLVLHASGLLVVACGTWREQRGARRARDVTNAPEAAASGAARPPKGHPTGAAAPAPQPRAREPAQ